MSAHLRLGAATQGALTYMRALAEIPCDSMSLGGGLPALGLQWAQCWPIVNGRRLMGRGLGAGDLPQPASALCGGLAAQRPEECMGASPGRDGPFLGQTGGDARGFWCPTG